MLLVFWLQEATRRMLKLGKEVFFTGASASLKKVLLILQHLQWRKFGLRGLAQSLARELHPRNIHISHFIIDGIIKDKSLSQNTDDNQLDPDEIAKNYLNVFYKKKIVGHRKLIKTQQKIFNFKIKIV